MCVCDKVYKDDHKTVPHFHYSALLPIVCRTKQITDIVLCHVGHPKQVEEQAKRTINLSGYERSNSSYYEDKQTKSCQISFL